MPGEQHALRILLVQRWTVDSRPIERSLRAAGVDASLTRVDFEAALHAALVHARFDLAIFDASTPGLTREIVERCFKVNNREIPLVMLDDVATIGERVVGLLAGRRN